MRARARAPPRAQERARARDAALYS
jgi:hypothetical protein